MAYYKIHVGFDGLLCWRGALVSVEEGAIHADMQAFNKLLQGGESMRRSFIRRFCQVMYNDNLSIVRCWGRACHVTGGKRIEPPRFYQFARMTGRNPIGEQTIKTLARAFDTHRSQFIARKSRSK